MLKRDLVKFNNNNPPKKTLGRNDKVQKRYDDFLSKKENIELFKENIISKLNKKEFYLDKNDFSYNVDESIEHWLIWWKSEIDLDTKLKTHFGDKLITYWTNLKNNNSIKEISHAHIFVEV